MPEGAEDVRSLGFGMYGKVNKTLASDVCAPDWSSLLPPADSDHDTLRERKIWGVDSGQHIASLADLNDPSDELASSGLGLSFIQN